ncbi:hypothetical protein B0H13DRAFT_2443024 [Mycena leptocephala]|nr:hypothetical protein B0H13DRAFT_2443024 [Mycena leptocephala]
MRSVGARSLHCTPAGPWAGQALARTTRLSSLTGFLTACPSFAGVKRGVASYSRHFSPASPPSPLPVPALLLFFALLLLCSPLSPHAQEHPSLEAHPLGASPLSLSFYCLLPKPSLSISPPTWRVEWVRRPLSARRICPFLGSRMYCITRALRDGWCRGACAFVQLGPLPRVPVSGARPRVSKDVNVDVLRVSWICREGSIRRGWSNVGCGEMGACTSHPARKFPLCMCIVSPAVMAAPWLDL